jgi:hypothetical protein
MALLAAVGSAAFVWVTLQPQVATGMFYYALLELTAECGEETAWTLVAIMSWGFFSHLGWIPLLLLTYGAAIGDSMRPRMSRMSMARTFAHLMVWSAWGASTASFYGLLQDFDLVF